MVGTVFWVDYGTGSDGVNTKANSLNRPFKTVAKALSVCTTNKDDVIALIGNSTHALTEMLDVSNSRVHFVGVDCTNRRYGQNAKISLGVTTAATDLAAMQNTGVRNSFRNIKFISNNTQANSIYGVIEAGEYAVYDSCEIYKSQDLDVTGAAEFVMNGDSAQVRNCYIGSTVDIASGAITRATVLVTKGIVAGKVARDVTFENCTFAKKAGHVNNRYFYGANATDVERMFHIKDCTFFNTKLAIALPAQCVAFAAEQTEGFVLIDNCTSINNTKLSTTTGVYIAGPVPTYATTGIAVAS
jgi:hypothetical protein